MNSEPDGLFMIFTAYFDESDTHGSAPDIMMSCVLGSGREWQLFGRGLRGLQKQYGFKVFHATHLKSRIGEFKGWHDDKCSDLLGDMGKLVGKTLSEAVSVTLSHTVYKKHFLDVRPPKMHRISQYGICFLLGLETLSRYVFERGKNNRLSVVVESGHANAADTARIFKERREEHEMNGLCFLQSHTLAKKADSPYLMFADATAHASAMEAREIRLGFGRHMASRSRPRCCGVIPAGPWLKSKGTT